MFSASCVGEFDDANKKCETRAADAVDKPVESARSLPPRDQSKYEVLTESSYSTWPSINFPTLLIPRYNHIFYLLLALLLSTTLAFLSAVDAAHNCFKYSDDVDEDAYYYGDTYYYGRRFLYYDYDDKDDAGGNAYYYDDDIDDVTSQPERCRALFMNVVVPICPAVVLLCALASKLTMRNDNKWDKQDDKDLPAYVVMADHDRKRLEELRRHVNDQAKYLRSCFALLLLSILCLSLWVCAYVLIFEQSDRAVVNDNNDDQEYSHFQVNFASLGAVNEMGEVGQNANLYYTIWICLGICIALVYEMTRMTFVQHQTSRNLSMELAIIMRHMENEATAFEAVRTWSTSQQEKIQDSRKTWFDSLYKLRQRTGIWLSTFVSSLVLYSSSNRVWRNLVYPAALSSGELHEDGSGMCDIIHGYFSTETMDEMGFIHPSICERTKVAKLTGIVSVYLSFFALLAHFVMRTMVARETASSSRLLRESQNYEALARRRKMLIPMRAELFLALLLSTLLGINAFFTTAVAGPAPRVGDLYYSTWVSFLLSMRLVLGCWEEIVNEDDEHQRNSEAKGNDDNNNISVRCISLYGGDSKRSLRKGAMTKVVMMSDNYALSLSPSKEDEFSIGTDDVVTVGSYYGGMPITKMSGLQREMFEDKNVEEEETSRTKRLRRWGCIVIFASLYSFSILDSAAVISNGDLDLQQKYMVICPVVVATISVVMFCMCLGFNSYEVFVGGIVGAVLSILVFGLWVCNLVITLHSPSSWAVNEIGEIKLANLYYFTWLCVFNAGLLSSSYVKSYMKKRFNVVMKSKDVTTILWLAIVKVCFVMFGSSCDIYLSVKDECSTAQDSIVFCRRTQIGAFLSFAGMAVGSCAAICRYFFSNPSMLQVRTEGILSGVLCALFAVSLGLITGIGGPGQVVGDLYYASWLSFLVSLGATTNIHDEYRKKIAINAHDELFCNASSESGHVTSGGTSYKSMKDTEIV